jgi:hypothetical protein
MTRPQSTISRDGWHRSRSCSGLRCGHWLCTGRCGEAVGCLRGWIGGDGLRERGWRDRCEDELPPRHCRGFPRRLERRCGWRHARRARRWQLGLLAIPEPQLRLVQALICGNRSGRCFTRRRRWRRMNLGRRHGPARSVGLQAAVPRFPLFVLTHSQSQKLAFR